MSLKTLSCFFIIVLNFGGLFAQSYGISPEFHQQRRSELRNKMPNNTAAVFFSSPIRNRANDVDFIYHQDPNFYYLTGWIEPHAVLVVFNATQYDEIGPYNEILYVRDRNAREELWNGKQMGVAGAKTMGFDRVKNRNTFNPDEETFVNFDTVFFFDFKNV